MTPTASSAKSPPGSNNETPPALASNGCSQPKKPAPKWAAPTPSRPKSHNHCAEVLVELDLAGVAAIAVALHAFLAALVVGEVELAPAHAVQADAVIHLLRVLKSVGQRI